MLENTVKNVVSRRDRGLPILFTILVVTAAGLLVGCIDIHSVHTFWEAPFYLIVCTFLGFRFPRLCWLWPAIFAYTLYAAHIWAIRHGFHQPYVEENSQNALSCLIDGIPSMLVGLAAGAIRYVVTESKQDAGIGKYIGSEEHMALHADKATLLRASEGTTQRETLLRAIPATNVFHEDLLRAAMDAPVQHDPPQEKECALSGEL